MSDEQAGKYIRLLCLQHQKGHLTEEQVMGICDIKDVEVLCKFHVDKKGNYFNERLQKEMEKRAKYTQSRRKNLGIKGIKGVPHMDNHMDIHMDTHMSPHMENENEDVNTNINTSINSREKVKRISENKNEFLGQINEYTNSKILLKKLQDFIAYRKEMKSPITERALKILFTTLDKLTTDDSEKVEIIEQSILNNWKGVFGIKKSNISQNKKAKTAFDEVRAEIRKEEGYE